MTQIARIIPDRDFNHFVSFDLACVEHGVHARFSCAALGIGNAGIIVDTKANARAFGHREGNVVIGGKN